MPGIARIWGRIKPWLERLEHSDFLFGWLAWKWLTPMIGGVIIAALAWWNHAPAYVRGLAGLAAFVLILGTINLALQIQDRSARRAALAALPPGAARRAMAQAAPDVIKLTQLIGACVFISIITSIFWYTLQIIHYESIDVKNAYLDVVPVQLRSRSPNYLKVGVDVYFQNASQTYPMVGLLHQHRFEYPPKQLNKSDEDIVMREVLAGLDKPVNTGSEMRPHGGRWGTFEDDRLGDAQWQEFIDGKRLIYLILGFTYFVGDTVKVTESCMWLMKGFPAHECHDHNKTIAE